MNTPRKFSKEQLAFIEEHRDWNIHDRWWDAVYDDFIDVAKAFGFDIVENGINFSGFSSQGDGACFSTDSRTNLHDILVAGRATLQRGDYGTPSNFSGVVEAFYDIYAAIERDCAAASLSAECLAIMAGSAFGITTSGRYSHSHTMDIDFDDHSFSDEVTEAWESAPESFKTIINDLMKDMLQACRDCADALYVSLETESEYQQSDEAVWDSLEANENIPDNLKFGYSQAEPTALPFPSSLDGWIREMKAA